MAQPFCWRKLSSSLHCLKAKITDSVRSSIHRGFLKPGSGSPVVQPSWLCLLTFWGCLASAPAMHTDNGCGCCVQWVEVKAVFIPLASTLLHETCISADPWPIASSLAIWSATWTLQIGRFKIALSEAVNYGNKLQLLKISWISHVDAHNKGLFSDEAHWNQASDWACAAQSCHCRLDPSSYQLWHTSVINWAQSKGFYVFDAEGTTACHTCNSCQKLTCLSNNERKYLAWDGPCLLVADQVHCTADLPQRWYLTAIDTLFWLWCFVSVKLGDWPHHCGLWNYLCYAFGFSGPFNGALFITKATQQWAIWGNLHAPYHPQASGMWMLEYWMLEQLLP